ncbi:MAG: asparaginase [Pseudomonadota bacterium]
MDIGAPLVEIWRGDLLESQHSGHIVICGPDGQVQEAWGNPDLTVFPRSSCKMIQALPLLTSGAADAHDLTAEHLALSCASHQGAAIHREHVTAWLSDLGLGESALRCGPQAPADIEERDRLITASESPCQIHNNCSGKHTGFLTLGKHLGAGPEYLELSHPVQVAAREAFEETTGEDSPTWAIDGCSAPNFATSLTGLARAMAAFATAHERADAASKAMVRLRDAMMLHPDLVAGETRACTELMRAAPGVALKTGAEGVFTAIVPEKGLGIALKISDGTTRAAEAAITALLQRLDLLDPKHPAAQNRLGPITNWRGFVTGHTTATTALS